MILNQENSWTLYHKKRSSMRNDFYNEDLNCIINDKFLKSVYLVYYKISY